MTKPNNECIVEVTTGPRKGESGRVITRETPDPGQYWVQLSDGPELIWESDFRVIDGKL